MPKGLVRLQASGDLHFITFSCFQRKPYLIREDAAEVFELSLETMRVRYDFCVYGYVMTPEHVHLLLGEPKRAVLSKALQALKLSVSVQRSERPFWQARYYDFNVYTRHKRIEKLKYLRRNPVTRGLVAEPDAWRWSSFHHYATGEIGTVEIESDSTANRRNRAAAKAHVSESRHGAPHGLTK